MVAAVRLASVKVIPYALPFKEPYVTARGSLTRREMVLLRIRDEDGFEGVGEAVPLSLRGGVTIEAVVKELEEIATDLPNTFDGLSLPARCAVTTALLDHAKRRGAVTSERHPVRCNATLVTGAPKDVAAEAERGGGAGVGAVTCEGGGG